jgi:hypothetical protein
MFYASHLVCMSQLAMTMGPVAWRLPGGFYVAFSADATGSGYESPSMLISFVDRSSKDNGGRFGQRVTSHGQVHRSHHDSRENSCLEFFTDTSGSGCESPSVLLSHMGRPSEVGKDSVFAVYS